MNQAKLAPKQLNLKSLAMQSDLKMVACRRRQKPILQVVSVYNGPGVSAHSFSALKELFATHTHISVREIGPTEVKKKAWADSTRLFVVPGGRDLPYLEHLGNEGISAIREFVFAGGSYLGICAGAYFAADSIEFEVGGPLEVIGERYLKFFPGKACGTLFGRPYSYTTFDHITDATISFKGEEYSLLYGGGCFFEKISSPAISYLGNYVHAGEKPAIVETSYGSGRALLSGVHFEYSAPLVHSLPLRKTVKKTLIGKEEKRKRFVTRLLQHLGLL